MTFSSLTFWLLVVSFVVIVKQNQENHNELLKSLPEFSIKCWIKPSKKIRSLKQQHYWKLLTLVSSSKFRLLEVPLRSVLVLKHKNVRKSHILENPLIPRIQKLKGWWLKSRHTFSLTRRKRLETVKNISFASFWFDWL